MVFLLLFFLVLSSFILFSTSRHDFVLLRQNISIRLVFDRAAIILFASLILSRAFYLVDQKLYSLFLNPLEFFHIAIHWGFNYLGLFVGILFGTLIFFRKRKNILRILDIYFLSFYPLLILEQFSYLILKSFNIFFVLTHLAIVVIFYILFIKMHLGYGIRDGVVSFSIILLVSISYLATSFFGSGAISIYSPIQIVAAITIALSIYLLVLIYQNFFKEG